MSWDRIIGQTRVKQILISALRNNRLAHAYLFSGPIGVGKDAVAFEIAKVLNCESHSWESCDKCPNCQKFDTLRHPDLNLVFSLPLGKNEEKGDPPLAKLKEDDIEIIRQQIQLKAKNHYHRIMIPKANTIKINSIREIRKSSAMTTFGNGKKVFIILNAENLNEESANALLKTLEEPLDDTILILTTSQPEVLLPTIISRCQHVRFDSLTAKEIKDALINYEKIDNQQAEWISQVSNGSYLRALELIEPVFKEKSELTINFLRTALYKSKIELLLLIKHIVTEYQKPEIEELLYMLQNWLRSAMLYNQDLEAILSSDDSMVTKKFITAHPEIDYKLVFDAISRSISLLNRNVYVQLIFLNLALELRRIILTLKAINNSN